MDRTIKFRAKRIDNNKWAYGGLIQADDYCIIDQGNELYVERDYNFRGDTHFFQLSGVMCDEKTVGQFTGLLDKNGNEIYEGDIIKGFDIIIEVWYSEDTACFMAEMKEPQNDMVDILGGYDTARMEIIGNIYDHPQLIKEE
jgi:uncharacterized phage protein (TIGR01671 family)